jgi:hypothetical protein
VKTQKKKKRTSGNRVSTAVSKVSTIWWTDASQSDNE